MAWMWGALLAATTTMAAWLHQLTALISGEDILAVTAFAAALLTLAAGTDKPEMVIEPMT
jgi:hypothetical protein